MLDACERIFGRLELIHDPGGLYCVSLAYNRPCKTASLPVASGPYRVLAHSLTTSRMIKYIGFLEPISTLVPRLRVESGQRLT